MGNSQSTKTFFKLHCVMPPVNHHGGDNPLTGWLDKSTKPFVSEEDRKQFIYATITVITENGAIDVRDHDFRLLYSRRKGDRLVARLVAEKEGVIRTQVVADGDGKNQIEAFQALRKHVETQLDNILSGLPSATAAGTLSRSDTDATVRPGDNASAAAHSSSSAAGSRTTSASLLDAPSGNGRTLLLNDAPPAYGKAVKEWRTSEEKKG